MGYEAFKHRLICERDSVLLNLGVKVDSLARAGRVADEDQAQCSYEEFVSLTLNSLDYAKLRPLNEAFQRVEDGDYGVCQQCDKAIPARRLEVLPWAKYCVPCQEHLSLIQEQENEAWSGKLDSPVMTADAY